MLKKLEVPSKKFPSLISVTLESILCSFAAILGTLKFGELYLEITKILI